jgi:hypothetical protein
VAINPLTPQITILIHVHHHENRQVNLLKDEKHEQGVITFLSGLEGVYILLENIVDVCDERVS